MMKSEIEAVAEARRRDFALLSKRFDDLSFGRPPRSRRPTPCEAADCRGYD